MDQRNISRNRKFEILRFRVTLDRNKDKSLRKYIGRGPITWLLVLRHWQKIIFAKPHSFGYENYTTEELEKKQNITKSSRNVGFPSLK